MQYAGRVGPNLLQQVGGRPAGQPIRRYVEERIKIAKKTAQQVESRIRTGAPPLGELGIPPGLSTKFGERTKMERIAAIRRLLTSTFPIVKQFSETRIVR